MLRRRSEENLISPGIPGLTTTTNFFILTRSSSLIRCIAFSSSSPFPPHSSLHSHVLRPISSSLPPPLLLPAVTAGHNMTCKHHNPQRFPSTHHHSNTFDAHFHLQTLRPSSLLLSRSRRPEAGQQPHVLSNTEATEMQSSSS